MFEQHFAFSLVDFNHMAAIWLWYLVFRFFGWDFFLNGFPNPFILGLVFCLNQIFISRRWVFFRCGVLTLIFCFFFYFIWFFLQIVPIHSVRSRSSIFCSQWKLFELYVRTCPSMFFYFVVRIFVTTIWRHNHLESAFCSSVHAISSEVGAWRHFSLLVERAFLFFRVITFLVTLDLPHSQKLKKSRVF